MDKAICQAHPRPPPTHTPGPAIQPRGRADVRTFIVCTRPPTPPGSSARHPSYVPPAVKFCQRTFPASRLAPPAIRSPPPTCLQPFPSAGHLRTPHTPTCTYVHTRSRPRPSVPFMATPFRRPYTSAIRVALALALVHLAAHGWALVTAIGGKASGRASGSGSAARQARRLLSLPLLPRMPLLLLDERDRALAC